MVELECGHAALVRMQTHLREQAEADRTYSYMGVGLCSHAPTWKVPSNIQVLPQSYILLMQPYEDCMWRETKFHVSTMTTSVLQALQRKGEWSVTQRSLNGRACPVCPIVPSSVQTQNPLACELIAMWPPLGHILDCDSRNKK